MFKTRLDKFKENFKENTTYFKNLHKTNSLQDLEKCVYDMNSFVNSVDEFFMIYGSFTPDYPYFSDDSIDVVFDFNNKNIELNPLAKQEIFDLVCFSFEKEYCQKYGIFPDQNDLEKIAKKFYRKNRSAIDDYFNTKTSPTKHIF